MSRTTNSDTIAAISTPPGEGGIGIVRLSGPDAIEMVARAFVSSSGRDIRSHASRVFHGAICDDATEVDEVLVHVMRAPNSFTREDVVEINGHGGAVPLQSILSRMLREGARIAQPGEFTRRAFLNGRIDLIQAEAVIDRIRAQTEAGLRAANAAADGHLSRQIGQIAEALRASKAHIEAAVDFPDDDLPELLTPELRESLQSAVDAMDSLLRTAETGRLLREGASVAVVGRPNVGKSTLFNALLRESRAIVTPHAGTTRDRLEEKANIGGIPIRLIDTAGIRESEDEVEQIGIGIARETLAQADVVVLVLDSSQPLQEEDHDIYREVDSLNVPVIGVCNKDDIASNEFELGDLSFDSLATIVATEARQLEELEALLVSILTQGQAYDSDRALLSRTHQRDSLRRAHEHAARLVESFDASPEFLAIDLDDAMRALGEITGETTPDDILDRIFGQFCIGK